MDAKNWGVKYRPKSFEEFYGNKSEISALKKAIKKGEIPQTLLIYGKTGSGKTSLSRIIAQTINGTRKTDYSEENMATNGGIDSIKALIQKANYKPKTNYNILMLDEAHSLTSQAANALLKPLEEPPKYTIWILATSEPQKLLLPISGRNFRINLDFPSTQEMIELLQSIAKQKKIKIKEKVLLKIIEFTQGQPRAAINLLQRVSLGDNIFKDDPQFEDEHKTAIKTLYNIYQQKDTESLSLIRSIKNKHGFLSSMLFYNRVLIDKSLGVFTHETPNQKLLFDKLKGKLTTQKLVFVQAELARIKDKLVTVPMDDFITEFYNICYGDLKI